MPVEFRHRIRPAAALGEIGRSLSSSFATTGAFGMQLTVNSKRYDLEVEPEMPLLWVLRDELGISGPKYGCGAGLCGACTVHIDGTAVRSCSINAGEVRGSITTIEGLGTPANLHVVQQAWIENQVAQCGYCKTHVSDRLRCDRRGRRASTTGEPAAWR